MARVAIEDAMNGAPTLFKRFVGARFIAPACCIIIFFATSLDSQQTNTNAPGIIKLDAAGKRGVVYFDHDSHEIRISPDPAYPYPAKADATCTGCHHTTNNVGVIQLVKCSACHLEPGDVKNPKDKELNEISTDEAFHRNCIGCHRFSKSAPRLCTGCHFARTISSAGVTPALRIAGFQPAPTGKRLGLLRLFKGKERN